MQDQVSHPGDTQMSRYTDENSSFNDDESLVDDSNSDADYTASESQSDDEFTNKEPSRRLKRKDVATSGDSANGTLTHGQKPFREPQGGQQEQWQQPRTAQDISTSGVTWTADHNNKFYGESPRYYRYDQYPSRGSREQELLHQAAYQYDTRAQHEYLQSPQERPSYHEASRPMVSKSNNRLFTEKRPNFPGQNIDYYQSRSGLRSSPSAGKSIVSSSSKQNESVDVPALSPVLPQGPSASLISLRQLHILKKFPSLTGHIHIPRDGPGQQIPSRAPRNRVSTAAWEQEGTLCIVVEHRGMPVTRRCDNNMINGTKLLNSADITRGRRDGVLKGERVRHVVKMGVMNFKGVWIPFERALDMAKKENILDDLYPLFIADLNPILYSPQNSARLRQIIAKAARTNPAFNQWVNGIPPSPLASSLTSPPKLITDRSHHMENSNMSGGAQHYEATRGTAYPSMNGEDSMFPGREMLQGSAQRPDYWANYTHAHEAYNLRSRAAQREAIYAAQYSERLAQRFEGPTSAAHQYPNHFLGEDRPGIGIQNHIMRQQQTSSSSSEGDMS